MGEEIQVPCLMQEKVRKHKVREDNYYERERLELLLDVLHFKKAPSLKWPRPSAAELLHGVIARRAALGLEWRIYR